ncbi:MAG TPA: NADH-ubiquinone oxidoreductase-F iron-sulfur binding region domain-containing protein, partial [Acidimicrobiales bacterium]|nr:NADH-ubiquinone oxidoreductase-F iron-sulfur binding region domain-containing protein [Acidimicrobiales bacterium]
QPASRKDALLLTRAPHLVLDGLSLAAATLRAHRAIVYVPRHTAPAVEHALDERRRRRTDAVDIEIAECPHTYLAGQETAVVNQLGGRRDAVPAFQGLTSIRERGVDGRATLVQNAETLAHVALIGRFGGTWFRSVGAEDSPGTMLMTVTRAAGAHIVEAVLGSSLRQSAWISDDDMATTQGVLLGGYGGGWVSPRDFGELPVSEKAARRLGATLGAGVVALLPRDVCPLAEMAHVIRYMEGQGAGQCGPCVYGLADLAAAMEVLAWGRGHGSAHPARILEVCDLVEGRGACRHPDGVARFARSGLAVFAEELAAHVQHGPCARVGAPRVLPGPGRAHPPAGAGRGTTSRRLVSRA